MELQENEAMILEDKGYFEGTRKILPEPATQLTTILINKMVIMHQRLTQQPTEPPRAIPA
jgi:hypothetical protein